MTKCSIFYQPQQSMEKVTEEAKEKKGLANMLKSFKVLNLNCGSVQSARW
jgi:hypothetical protein